MHNGQDTHKADLDQTVNLLEHFHLRQERLIALVIVGQIVGKCYWDGHLEQVIAEDEAVDRNSLPIAQKQLTVD